MYRDGLGREREGERGREREGYREGGGKEDNVGYLVISEISGYHDVIGLRLFHHHHLSVSYECI